MSSRSNDVVKEQPITRQKQKTFQDFSFSTKNCCLIVPPTKRTVLHRPHGLSSRIAQGHNAVSCDTVDYVISTGDHCLPVAGDGRGEVAIGTESTSKTAVDGEEEDVARSLIAGEKGARKIIKLNGSRSKCRTISLF